MEDLFVEKRNAEVGGRGGGAVVDIVAAGPEDGHRLEALCLGRHGCVARGAGETNAMLAAGVRKNRGPCGGAAGDGVVICHDED
jgi:hypothetical protein